MIATSIPSSSKRVYIRWYYWYKNFWDELLLLWLLRYVHTHIWKLTEVTDWSVVYLIACEDTDWTKSRVDKHAEVLPAALIGNIRYISLRSIPLWPRMWDVLVLWWWEVLADARPFPYNGRVHMQYIFRFLFSEYWIVWGISKPEKYWSKILYRLLLNNASRVVLRESVSYAKACEFAKDTAVHLYHDFAYDALDCVSFSQNSWFLWDKADNWLYWIININRHIWNSETKRLINRHLKEYAHISQWYFFPASVWVDDADSSLLDQLEYETWKRFSVYDWSSENLSSIMWFVKWSSYVIAARLHVVILCLYLWVPYTPLRYQEKVQKIITERESSTS